MLVWDQFREHSMDLTKNFGWNISKKIVYHWYMSDQRDYMLKLIRLVRKMR